MVGGFKHRFFAILIGFTILFCQPLHLAIADNIPAKAPIIGGEFTSLTNGPVALILTDSFLCSGILVGPREVLTAAHCVTGEGANYTPNSEYYVIVGGKVREIESRYYNSSYSGYLPAYIDAPYDTAILILKKPVTETDPVPVLINDSVLPGEEAAILGYGTNEISGVPGRYPWQNAKVAKMIVASVDDGLISGTHFPTGASACHGDSGGPAIQSIGGYLAVVGTLSIGVNLEVNGTCYLSGDGSFSYVNLQSQTSQQFMRNFSGIQYLSGYRVYVKKSSEELALSLTKLLFVRSLPTLVRKATKPLRELKMLKPYADGVRRSKILAATKSLQYVKKARSLKSAVQNVKKARKMVLVVSELGVN